MRISRLFAGAMFALALGGCAATVGVPADVGAPATAATPARPATPSTQSTVYAKTWSGSVMAGGNTQWVTIDTHNGCQVFAHCTTEEQNALKSICDRVVLAYGIPVSVPTADGAARGLGVVGGSVASTSAIDGFGGIAVVKNFVLDGGLGTAEYADQGANMGVQDKLRFLEKCGDGFANASGFTLGDVRFARGPAVIHLLPSGDVAPNGPNRSVQDTDGPLIDTSMMAPEDKALIDGCQAGINRNDPLAFPTINACVRSRSQGHRFLFDSQAPAASTAPSATHHRRRHDKL